jgi:hypothetical protein
MTIRHAVRYLALSALLSGCAESTLVRSYPAGAKVFLNGDFKGITPIALTVPHAQFSAGTFRVRVEHEGYTSEERTLQTETCSGRVVGGVFTLGILLIFKPPTCFVSPQDFALNAEPGHIPTAEATPVHNETVEDRLQRIQTLHERGTISDAEYDHYRQEILQGH